MNILVIGAGYIGAEAACYWSSKKHHVTATTRNLKRLDKLSRCSQKCVLLESSDEEALLPLVKQNDAIVVTVAADSPADYETAYLGTAHTLKRIASRNDLSRYLLYTSSTAVYGDHQGLWVNEHSELKAADQRGKILIETESFFQSLTDLGWSVCILRLAEIYGPGRDLSQKLSASKGWVFPKIDSLFTNMIHSADVTRALDFALKHRLTGIFNLADDDHMPRKEIYKRLLGQKEPAETAQHAATEVLSAANKRVSNTRIKAQGFAFLHPKRVLT